MRGIKGLRDLNMCHRDIKPENILYVYQNASYIMKLCDFGTSKKVSEPPT